MGRVILNPRAGIEKRLFRLFHRDAVLGGLVAVALVPLKTLDKVQIGLNGLVKSVEDEIDGR